MNIVELVKSIETRKKLQKLAPAHAMLEEILNESTLSMQETRSELNKAIGKGFLRYGRTINSYYITAE